jgi:hypothetical protein
VAPKTIKCAKYGKFGPKLAYISKNLHHSGTVFCMQIDIAYRGYNPQKDISA